MHSSLQATEQASAAVAKTDQRVSLASMEEKIQEVEYIWSELIPHMTIAIVLMKNGFGVVGKSAPADPENFAMDLVKKFAYEDAVRQLWQLEGYALRTRLTEDTVE